MRLGELFHIGWGCVVFGILLGVSSFGVVYVTRRNRETDPLSHWLDKLLSPIRLIGLGLFAIGSITMIVAAVGSL